MEATILHNPVWEHKTGSVIKEDEEFVTVRLFDAINKKLVYDIKFPRKMVKMRREVARA